MTPPDRPERQSFAPIQVPLGGLPPGVKIGDMVQLSVDNIDETASLATLSADKGLSHGENDPLAAPAADEESDPGKLPQGNDTSVLLGPMSGLKNYLVKKSQDNSAAEIH